MPATDVSGAIIPMPGGASSSSSLGALGMPDFLLADNPEIVQGDTGEWWFYEGVVGRPVGEVPQWALDKWGTPEGVYGYYSQFAPDERQAIWTGDAQQAEIDAQALESFESGLAQLDPIDAALADLLSGAQDDPQAQYVTDELTRRSGDDYSLIGGATQTAIERELALGLNRAQGSQQAALTRAGWGRSGLAAGLDPLFGAIGSAGLGQIYAGSAQANQQARDVNLARLGAFDLGRDQFEAGIAGMQTQAGQYRAAFEAGEPLSGFDPWIGYTVSESNRLQAEESQRLEEAMGFLEQESQPDPLAFLFEGLQAFPGFLGGLLS